MHAAPVVELRCGADGASRSGVVVLLGFAAAIVAAWALALAGASPLAQAVTAAGAALAAGVAGMRAWRPHRHGARLRWDGGGWQWAPDPRTPPVDGVLAVAIDLDAWLLLRFDGVDGRRRWIALSRAQDSARWHALRCAVHARGTDHRALTRLPV